MLSEEEVCARVAARMLATDEREQFETLQKQVQQAHTAMDVAGVPPGGIRERVVTLREEVAQDHPRLLARIEELKEANLVLRQRWQGVRAALGKADEMRSDIAPPEGFPHDLRGASAEELANHGLRPMTEAEWDAAEDRERARKTNV